MEQKEMRCKICGGSLRALEGGVYQCENNAEHQFKEDPVPTIREYVVPPLDLLASDAATREVDTAAVAEEARLLEIALNDLKMPARVVAITRGHAFTRYELMMPPDVPVKRIEQYASDIACRLACNGKIRLEIPIPGKTTVGVEVPNEKRAIVRLRALLSHNAIQEAAPLTVAIGQDIDGNFISYNLAKKGHLLIAGTTGSGKSICLHSIVVSLLYKATPEDVRLILIDPKRVEFAMYRGLPHLLCEDVINEASQAVRALNWAREEMERRYGLFGKYGVRDMEAYNKSEAVTDGTTEKLPQIVVIVDELADLMFGGNREALENNIVSLAQKSRAAGITLVLATQRPTVDVITGVVKSNINNRIAFAVKSAIDSRVILDAVGAETLLGFGDMLYSDCVLDEPLRVQGAYVSDQEICKITDFVRAHNKGDFDDAFVAAINKPCASEVSEDKEEDDDEDDEEIFDALVSALGEDDDEDEDEEFDVLVPEVLQFAIATGSVGTALIQRRFGVGYARASRILDQLEKRRFVGPLTAGKPREVYITREQYEQLFGKAPAKSAPEESKKKEGEGMTVARLRDKLFEWGLESYEKGQYADAIKQLHKAAALGQAEAQYCLGSLYYFGKGIQEDRAEAEKWLKKAAAQGHAGAKEALKQLGVE